MKFNTPFYMSIPEPCDKDWDKMSLSAEGKHCESCHKIVVDFVNMSNEEVLQYLQKSNRKVCGRITRSQLNQYSPKFSKKIKVFLYSFALVFLVGINNMAIGQTIVHKDSNSISSNCEIYGNVKDEKNFNLSFCNITVSLGGVIKAGTKSDSNGNFKITNLKEGIYDISFSYVGYKKYTINWVRIGNESTFIEDVKMELQKSGKRCEQPIIGNISSGYKIIDPANPNRKTFTKHQIDHFPH